MHQKIVLASLITGRETRILPRGILYAEIHYAGLEIHYIV